MPRDTAVIGLGNMGRGIARNLDRAGRLRRLGISRKPRGPMQPCPRRSHSYPRASSGG